MVEEHLVRLQSDDCNLAIDLHSECVDTALSWHSDECKLQERHKDGAGWRCHPCAWLWYVEVLTNEKKLLPAKQPGLRQSGNQSVLSERLQTAKKKNLPNSWLKDFFAMPDRVSSDFYWPANIFSGLVTYMVSSNIYSRKKKKSCILWIKLLLLFLPNEKAFIHKHSF